MQEICLAAEDIISDAGNSSVQSEMNFSMAACSLRDASALLNSIRRFVSAGVRPNESRNPLISSSVLRIYPLYCSSENLVKM